MVPFNPEGGFFRRIRKRKEFFGKRNKRASAVAAMRSPLIIWLHGLGDTGRGWSHLKHELRLPQAVRYAFPDAPESPVTCNGGYVMTSWMDLETIPIGNGLPDDAKGLADSTQIIHALIDAEVAKGTASEDIVLGGFSQGGAMALLAGYSYAKRLAGVACLSGWPSLRALSWLGRRVRRRCSRCGGVNRRAAGGARGRRRQRWHAALHRPRHAGASCCPRVARCEDALFTERRERRTASCCPSAARTRQRGTRRRACRSPSWTTRRRTGRTRRGWRRSAAGRSRRSSWRTTSRADGCHIEGEKPGGEAVLVVQLLRGARLEW